MIRLRISKPAISDIGFILTLAVCPALGLAGWMLEPGLVGPGLSIGGLLAAVFAPKFSD